MAVTKYQFESLENLYYYYNVELFDAELPDCLINLSRKNGSAGFFAPERWVERATEKVIHEISINPDTMNISDKYWHSTLVHEMCHLWQQVHGKPSRRCYHNLEWANKMQRVGLMPSHNGQPGGKITGQTMADYVIKGGVFDIAFSKISAEDLDRLKLPYASNIPVIIPVTQPVEIGEETGEKKAKAGQRTKYSCSCGNNIWGKGGLQVECLDCHTTYQEQ